MAVYLKASDILDNRNLSGWSVQDICGMLEHYGFENVRSNGHTIYRHRDYPDLLKPIPHHAGEVKRVDAINAAKLCMEVKRRNAEGRKGIHTPIPEWAKDVFGAGTLIEHPNNSMTYEHRGIVDMDDVPLPPMRIYEIILQQSSMTVRSADFPNDEMHFTIREGDRHREQGLTKAFAQFDSEVARHIEDINSAFDARLKRAVENRGFQCSQESLPNHRQRLHLYHALYRLDYWLDMPPPGRPVKPIAIHELERAMQEHDERYYAQMDMLDAMSAQGWTSTHKKAEQDKPGALIFTHGIKKLIFEVPTYGELEMFDSELVESIAATLERDPNRKPNSVREIMYHLPRPGAAEDFGRC